MSGNVASNRAVEPALNVGSREELVYLLGQACEIEHGAKAAVPEPRSGPSSRTGTRWSRQPSGS